MIISKLFLKKLRNSFKQIRAVIKLDGTEERISYGMPAYKTYGRPLVYFAGFSSSHALLCDTLRAYGIF